MVSSGMRGRLRTWLGGPAPARRADLSERSGFFLDLLDGTHRWRERLVEELRFESRTHVRVVSSYQIDFPPDLLAQYVDLDAVDRLNVMLPLTTRDKAPLINFALSGPGGAPASLMSRASTAGLQSQYLDLLGRTSAAEGLPEMVPARLCEAVSAFTPGRYRDRFLNASRDHEVALLAYLRSGVGPFLDGESIGRSDVSRWRDSTNRAGAILARALGEHLDPLSSADELLLALPGLDPPPTAVAQIDAIVERYLAGIQAAERANDEVFLATLAEYGRRYEVVVEVELPLLESATVKMEEDLPLRLPRRPRGWIAQPVPLGDARSVHLEARVLDSGVEIAGFELRDEDGNDASDGAGHAPAVARIEGGAGPLDGRSVDRADDHGPDLPAGLGRSDGTVRLGDQSEPTRAVVPSTRRLRWRRTDHDARAASGR